MHGVLGRTKTRRKIGSRTLSLENFAFELVGKKTQRLRQLKANMYK